jgi:outer membrane receptor for ferrienterochelin and colicin
MKEVVAAVLAVFVTSMPMATPLWAQTTAPSRDLKRATIEDLMNITITTATRNSEGATSAPARVRVVTEAQIQRRGYRSLADLLKDLPEFKLDFGGDQDYPMEVTVDGTRGGSRVVLLFDGIRISSPTNEPLPILANYPVHAVQQIEIVYGPASALYGADAFSAVVNIISKEMTGAPALAVGTSIGQFGLYNQTASYGGRLGAGASFLVAGQAQYDGQPDLSKYYPADFQGMTAQRSGTFNTIFGPMESARPVSPDYGIPMSSHSVQATLRAGPWQLTFFESRARISTTPAYSPDNAVYNAAAFNLNKLLVGAGSYTREFGGVTSTSTLTFSRHELDPQSGYWNVYSNMDKSYKYAYGSMAKAEQQLSWKPVPAITMTAGGTFERFYAIPQGADLNAPIRSHDQPGTILGTDIPDDFVKLRYANTGAFAQMQYAITPAVTVTAGARADYNTRYGGTFNPRVGLVARPSGTTTLKLLYGSAFLAPSPYQSFSHYGSFYSVDGGTTYASSYWHLPNPDLKPQHKKTVEVNLLQSAGSFQLSASAFYSRFAGLLKESDASEAYAGLYHGWPVDYIDFAVNQGHASTYGGTLGADYLLELSDDRRVVARAALALVDGRVSATDGSGTTIPIGAMAPLQFRLGADIDWRRWSVAPSVSVTGRQRLLALAEAAGPASRRTLDGYLTAGVHVRRNRLFKNVDVFATIENGFDARYRHINARAYTNPEELIGAPQNPRRLTIGFDLRLR